MSRPKGLELPRPDGDSYLETLRIGGAMVNVGLLATSSSYSPTALIDGNRILADSLVGSIGEVQDMLDFCAEHGIGAEIERISADQVNAAFDRVENSDCGTGLSSTPQPLEP
ncbi:hypothetical protein [Saccharopolyspora spinosa]|uniref:hypothetical protein n=1 Tax=Saccharopolyspora spinosa TaxID=60894 RepID=UPI0003086C08|nr:hypothetical protein [Saccharopolyspora spinosa]